MEREAVERDRLIQSEGICKDCKEKAIVVSYNKQYEYPIAVELCARCLTSRAQLQTIKEDKLPFYKLLEKIQGETKRRIQREIKSAKLLEYKGVNPWSHCSARYWIEQLAYVKGKSNE